MNNLKISNSARLFGKLRLGDMAYIAQGAILRSEDDSIKIGNSSWVLENSVLIGNKKNPLEVGSKTVFGHKCLAIGSKIGDLCEIGNSVTILAGSKIGNMCIFGEGTIIPENTIIPDNSVVVGRPGRVIRQTTQEDIDMITRLRDNDISISNYTENILVQEMEEDINMNNLYKHGDNYPVVSDTAKIYDSAEITGDVTIGENTIIAAGVKIIGDSHGPVKIGNNVQILENSVLHLLPDNQLIIGDNVTIGPGCMIHGTNIGSNTIIESASIICDNSKLGENVLVKSGSLVKQRSLFGDNEILEGFPAKNIGNNSSPQEKPDWRIKK